MNNSFALSRKVTAALAFLAMTGPIATDMYLSSFTDITAELGASASQVQFTLTAFLLGLGAGQLFLGPLSDRVGRRPVLIGALTVFAIASILAVFSPFIWVLIALRAVQGLSGAASIVLSRAIAADMTRGSETVRALSLIAMLVGLGPIIAPPIGAVVGVYFGWRGVLATIALMTVLMLLTSIFVLKESLPVENRHSGGIRTSLTNFKTLITNKSFLFVLIGFAACSATMMGYISASPFVGQVILGMNQVQYALSFAAAASSLICANYINAKLAHRIQTVKMLRFGTALSFSWAVIMLVIIAMGALTWWLFILCAFFMIAGAGFTMANASALALNIAKNVRGSGSALLGASQFLLSGSISPIVGAWGENTALPLGITIVTTSAISLTGVLLFMRSIKPQK